MYHIRTVGMCTSKAAIKMCTSRGGRVNVNPKYTQTHICRRQYSYGRWIFWWLTVCASVPICATLSTPKDRHDTTTSNMVKQPQQRKAINGEISH